ncbi:MAG: hypothetical protein QXJ45_07540 [Thermoproteota archaeon]
MVRSGVERRVTKYDKSVIPDVVRTKFEALKDTMVLNMQAMQTLIVDVENKVGQILNENGIAGVMRVPYLNFARAIFRASLSYEGQALRIVADAEKAKASALGLNTTILDSIIEVLGVPPAPSP